MRNLKFIIFALTIIIFIVNIYFVINSLINNPVDSLETPNSIVNLIMISRINQIIALVFSIIIILINARNTKKAKQFFWIIMGVNFFNAFAVFGVAKYLSMLNTA